VWWLERRYRIEEEAVAGSAGSLLRLRAGWAAKRRHPGLMRFEDLDVAAAEADQVAKLEGDRARIHARRKALVEDVNGTRGNARNQQARPVPIFLSLKYVYFFNKNENVKAFLFFKSRGVIPQASGGPSGSTR
jgi:hypothetical protein